MPLPLPPTRLQEIDRAFDRALDLTPAERSVLLAELSETDAALSAAVADLLAVAARGDARLDEAIEARLGAVLEAQLAAARELVPGDQIGRFRVISELGRGGMAVVYLAERADGVFDQKVAIKRIHQGLLATGGLQRFHQERQILATLNHASIARLLDGGIDATGFPFLAMEYVEGTPIDRYADQHRLTIAARLALFARVVHAVDYAHRHLVVHRDIKPSNILVTAEGDVKLLDFGIATLIDPSAAPTAAPLTQPLFRPLTPEYASPEQLAGSRITIVSDVYQLGLLLHELLTGVRARHLESGSLLEAAAVCAQPLGRPSAVVASAARRHDIATTRRTSSPALARTLRGDLDNIVAMAVHVAPDARYATAAALGDDVQRHLSGHAVRARGEATLYRASRFVRRHALALGASAAIAVLLVAIAVSESQQANRLAQERDRVRIEAAKAQGVTRFLLGLFEIPATAEANYASLSAREVLEYRAAQVDDLADQSPVVQAEIMSTVGYALLRLGSHDRGIALLERSLATRRQHLGDDHLDTAESLHRLGTGLNMKGEVARAEPHLRQALAIRERLLDAADTEVADTLTELSTAAGRLGGTDEAERLLLRALAIDRAANSDHQARVMNNLGRLHLGKGDDAAAERFLTEAIAYRRARFGNNHPDLPTNLINLAQVQLRRNLPLKAIPLLEEAVTGTRRIFGDTHASTRRVYAALVTAYRQAGDQSSAAHLELEAARVTGAPLRQPERD